MKYHLWKGNTYIEFEDWEHELSVWEREHFPQYFEKSKYYWTDKQKKLKNAVELYAGWGYRDYNELLRTQKLTRPNKNRLIRIKEAIEVISTAIEDNTVPENLVAYRFLGEKYFYNLKRNVKNQLLGRRFLEKGFCSTTLTRKSYESHIANIKYPEPTVILKILIPKNTHGIFVTPLAGRPSEAELLLAPFTEFRILQHSSIAHNQYLCTITEQTHHLLLESNT